MNSPFYARVAVSHEDAVKKVAEGLALVAVYGWIERRAETFSADIVCKEQEVLQTLKDLYPEEVLSRGSDFPGGLPSLALRKWAFINQTPEARAEEICTDVEFQLRCNGFQGRPERTLRAS